MKGLKYFIIGIMLCIAIYIGVFIGRITQINTVHISKNEAWSESKEITPVNLNTATLDDLRTLPGVGSNLAKEIIAYRERYGDYIVVEELLDVDGMSSDLFGRIKSYISVG